MITGGAASSTENTEFESPVAKTRHLLGFVKRTKVRRRVTAILSGLILSVPMLAALLNGLQLLQTSAMVNQPWGSGIGMASLLVGLMLYALICVIAGVLSGYALIPTIAFSWLLSLGQSTSQSALLWQLWITLGWSSFLPVMTAIYMGGAYSIWYCRFQHKIRIKDNSIEKLSEGLWMVLPVWIRTFVVALPAAIAVVVLLYLQSLGVAAALNVNSQVEASLLTTSVSPSRMITGTMLITFAALLLACCNSKSVFSSSIVSLLVLILPSLVFSFVGLSSFGVNTGLSSLQIWNVCSPPMGIVGTLVIITGVGAALAKRNP